jgi:hypothetical protein
MEIVAKKISKKSLFKLLFIGLTTGLSMFAIICGIAAFFGAETVQWNGIHRTGIEGLIYGFIMGPFLGFLFACVMWLLIAPGLWVYSFFRPIKVVFKDRQNEPAKVV